MTPQFVKPKNSERRRRNGEAPESTALRIETLPNGVKRIYWDVSNVPDLPDDDVLPPMPEGLAPDEPPWPTPDDGEFEPGTFGQRVLAKRRDLVELLVRGVPPVEFLPASAGMLVRGKRHQIAAPKKTGKSIGALVHWVDMIAADCPGVVVLDRENGQEEYARRLHGIFKYKGYGEEEIRHFRQRFHYFEFPQFRRGDGEDFRKVAEGLGSELVVFDSQRMFLTDLGLGEDSSDDYSEFMKTLVDPLFQSGLSTVILENTGHKEKGRARGTSGKGDLNEVLMVMEVVEPFDLAKKGRLKLKITDSRAGTRGEWFMDIGGGTFGSWLDPAGVDENPELQRAVIALLGETDGPIGQNRILDALRTRMSVGNQGHAKTLLNRWADDERCPIQRADRGGYVLGGGR